MPLTKNEENIESYSAEELQEFIDEEQLDELSSKLLNKYIKNAVSSPAARNLTPKSAKRTTGIHRALDKMIKHYNEENLDEISMTATGEIIGDNKTSAKNKEHGKKALDYFSKNKHSSGVKQKDGTVKTEDLETDISDYSSEELQEFMQTEEFAQLDEISRKALYSYLEKAVPDLKKDSTKTEKRAGGIKTAISKLVREIYDLDEISMTATGEIIGDNKTSAKNKEHGKKALDYFSKNKHSSGVKQKDGTVKTEDLDEKANEKQANHVVDAINNIKLADVPTKEKHLAYLKANLAPEDYEHIERLIKSESVEELEEADKFLQLSAIKGNLKDDEAFTKGLSPKTQKIFLDLKKKQDKMKKESVEDLDEISREKLTSYISAAKGDIKTDRVKGINLALKKKWGDPKFGFTSAKVPATESVEDLDEISMTATSKDATNFAKNYLTKELGIKLKEAIFNAIQADKLSEAKDILESIFAEKVADKLLTLKEQIAKKRGAHTYDADKEDAAKPKTDSNYISKMYDEVADATHKENMAKKARAAKNK